MSPLLRFNPVHARFIWPEQKLVFPWQNWLGCRDSGFLTFFFCSSWSLSCCYCLQKINSHEPLPISAVAPFTYKIFVDIFCRRVCGVLGGCWMCLYVVFPMQIYPFLFLLLPISLPSGDGSIFNQMI